MFKTPCVEIILYPELSRSKRQANISSRTMDAGNHRLLLTSSPAYYTFLETTENYTLQFQRKNQVCLSRPRVSTRPRVPASCVPRSRVPLLRVPRLRVSRPRVPASHILESHILESHVLESHVPVPRPSPYVPVPLLVTASSNLIRSTNSKKASYLQNIEIQNNKFSRSQAKPSL